MQCRVADVEINDCPRFLIDNTNEDSHCIIAHDEYWARVVLPLVLQDVTSALNVHQISEADWKWEAASRITLTNRDFHWDPKSYIYEEQDHACSDLLGGLLTHFARSGKQTLIINQVTATTAVNTADLYSDDNFGAVLKSHSLITVAQVSKTPEDANIAEIQKSATRHGTIQSNKRKKIDGNTLARRWTIPSDKDCATVKKTTHQGVRSTLHPTLSHRFPTDNRMLRYRRIPHQVFSDTLQSGCLSAARMKYGQAYCTSFGWSRCHPIKKKSEAHETLSLMFKHDCVPPRMIVDNSKEQSLGELR